MLLAQGNLAEACDCIELRALLSEAVFVESQTSLSWGLLDFYLKLCGLEILQVRARGITKSIRLSIK